MCVFQCFGRIPCKHIYPSLFSAVRSLINPTVQKNPRLCSRSQSLRLSTLKLFSAKILTTNFCLNIKNSQLHHVRICNPTTFGTMSAGQADIPPPTEELRAGKAVHVTAISLEIGIRVHAWHTDSSFPLST